MIGSTISHYKITEKLGEGGMGVVYKAQDTKLNRTVAIKFLPKKLSVHGEERERFTHEAQAASSLNHPNICTIYEIDEAEGETFIVMEYLDGVTLREWITKKTEQSEGYRKLGLKEAVDLVTQISEGLEKAHEQGIIHRDIKSENIMVTTEGRAKIMDFGLAKLRGTSKLTKTGSTIGTIAYMSPEQVEGMETDHRTDIFSVGVVFYEMLAGCLPFQAEHETAVMYEIINLEPKAITEIRRSVDTELNRIVMKCLEKDREIRYQSLRDIVVDLKRFRRDSEGKRIERTLTRASHGGETSTVQPHSPWKRSRMLMVIGVLILIAAGIIIFQKQFSPSVVETQPSEVKITKLTSLPGLEDQPTWSPDGKFIAYTTDDRGNYDIVVQPIAGGQPIRITDNPADDMQPAWSPDGSRLAFVSARDHGGKLTLLMSAGGIEPYLKGKNGDIYLAPAFGGEAVKLVANGFDPAWSPDGKTLVFRSIRSGSWDLWTVPIGGGPPRQLTNDPSIDYQPSWSPDGKWIIYGGGVSGWLYNLCLIPSEGGAPIPLSNDLIDVVKPVWSPDGKYIFFSSNRSGGMNIWKAAFLADTKSIGKPVRITVGEGEDVNIATAGNGAKLAFSTVRTSSDIWEITIATGKMRQVSFDTGNEDNPRVSRDGKTLLIVSNRTGKNEIWTMEINGNMISQLTSNLFGTICPRWSVDGERVSYAQLDDKGEGTLLVQSIKSVSSDKIAENGQDHEWSPDGKKIAYDFSTNEKTQVQIYDLEKKVSKQLVEMDRSTLFATWSPDEKIIAFDVEEKNSRHVWLIPSSGGMPKQLTFGESEYSHPQWSPIEKDVILCLQDHKNVCLISASTGKIRQLTNFKESSITLDYPSWSRDGQRIYLSMWKKAGDIYTLENY